jgi:quinol monooxygenase YgiN
MYTATMNYKIIPESMEDFISLWEENILNLAIKQPGFIRMQLLTRDSEAMAIGTWTEKTHAENFMALGVFKNLMSRIKHLLSGEPKPIIWTLSAFAGR